MSLSKPVVLLGTALAATAYGFKQPFHFIGTGYGMSMAALASVTGLMFRKSATATSALHVAGLFLYGARLASFLLRRRSSPGYQDNVKAYTARNATMTAGKKATMWLGVSVLYCCMFSPAYYSLQAAGQLPSAAASLPLMYAGLVLESVADAQKYAAKEANPENFVSTGVYRLCRHPNYLGEILFWSGNWLAGVSAYSSWQQWLVSGLGVASILAIMAGATRRLGAKQDAKYAGRAEWEQYRACTRPLLPVPKLRKASKAE